jgi:hypothetical protein
VFHENARNASPNQFGCLFHLDSCRHNEDLSPKAALSGRVHELCSVTPPQVEVEQHDVDVLLA